MLATFREYVPFSCAVLALSDLSQLMPHLIRGIDLPDVEIRTSTINTLLDVAEAGGATQEYATSLVPVVLRNALPQDLTSQVCTNRGV